MILLRNLMLQSFIIASIVTYYYLNAYGYIKQNVLLTEPIKQSMQATIISIPVTSNFCYQRFMLQDNHSHKNYLAHWYQCDAPKLKLGQIWYINTILKPIRNLNNPGGQDFVAWALRQHISASASIISATYLGENHGLKVFIKQQQEKLYIRIQDNQYLSEPFKSILLAYTLGIKQTLNNTTKQLFINTGTGHLLAISGLHMALIAGFLYLIFLVMIKPFSGLLRLDCTHNLALMSSLSVLFVYTLLVNTPTPTLRALIMFGLFVVAFINKRQQNFYYTWWLAAGIVLLFKPLAFFSVSFWFSFLAVVLLYAISTRLLKNKSKWQQYFFTQWLLGIMLLPMSLYCFNQFSIIGLLVNLLAIPLFSFILLPLSLITIVLLILPNYLANYFSFMIYFTNKIGVGFIKFLSLCNNHFHWVIYHPISLWVLILAMLGIISLFFIAKRNIRLLCFGCYGPIVLPIIFPITFPIDSIAKGQFTLASLNVGQGLSTIVQTKHHLLVYDTGLKSLSGSDMGYLAVLPYLHYLGKNTVDLLLISHGDNDHIGGAQSVLLYAQVKKILTSVPEKFISYHKPSHPTVSLCQQGQHWVWDGVQFDILYPDHWHQHLGNNSSCVLKITGQHRSALLTGDIEALAEQNLVKHNPAKLLSADILVVPHHGSRSSSTALLLNTVQPGSAVFSYGYLNRFHFPHPSVVLRYDQLGAKRYDTDNGAVIL